MNEKDVKLGEEFEAKRTRLEQENRTLNEKLERLTVEYSEKLSNLQSQQNQELKALVDGVAKENEVQTSLFNKSYFTLLNEHFFYLEQNS